MSDADFEWDPAKADANVRKHRVDFDTAKAVFDNPPQVRALLQDWQDQFDRYERIHAQDSAP